MEALNFTPEDPVAADVGGLPGSDHVDHVFDSQENIDNEDEASCDIPKLAPNQQENIIESQEEKKNCCGFEENIVLAVKECFFEDEIRCILIKKTKNGRKVKYFSRSCTSIVPGKKKVCEACDHWFTCLSAGIPLSVKKDKERRKSAGSRNNSAVESEDKKDLESIVKQEDKTKKEVEDDDWVPGKTLNQDLEEEEEKVEKRIVGRKKVTREKGDEYRVEGGWVCKIPECGEVLSPRKAWVKHVRSHSGKTKCKVCGTVVTKMEEHIKRRHPQDADKGISFFSGGVKKRGRKPYTRTKPFIMDKESDINYDEDRDELGNYMCRYDECEKLFDAKKSYLKHIFLLHEGGTANGKRKKICDICGNLITANNMKQHVRTVHTHKNEKNFACEHCGKEFKYRSELTIHLTHHTGEMNFACSGCAKRFRRAAEARLCEKGHRGIFSFRCHMCDYKTNKKNHLDRHIESHLKATPFICPICGFKSGRKDNLKQHIDKRHCSATTSIKQLEEMYPDMYKMHETNEAAAIAKTEALAENFARMHDSVEDPGDPNSDQVIHRMKAAPELEAMEVDKKTELTDKWTNKNIPPSIQSSQQNKFVQHNELASVENGEDYILPNQVSDPLSYALDQQQQNLDEVEYKYLPPSMKEAEHKYLPPPTSMKEAEHKFLPPSRHSQAGDVVSAPQSGDMVTDNLVSGGQVIPGQHANNLEDERYIQDEDDRIQDQRENYLRERERNRYLQERERILVEQRRRDYRDSVLVDRQRERLLVEQRERERLAAIEMLQEHRERLSQQQQQPGGSNGSSALAEVYQRMRSLE